MWIRVDAAAVVVASALLLSGCVAEPMMPVPPTAAEIDEDNQRLLDLTYKRAGLEGEVPRVLTAAPSDGDGWFDALFACLAANGIENSGITWDSEGGYSLVSSETESTSTRTKAAFYSCIAEHPRDLIAAGKLYSGSERRYLWDYFSNWLIPCLRLNGVELGAVPQRSDFLAVDSGVWTPYDAVPRRAGDGFSVDPSEPDPMLSALEAKCGSRLGLIGR